MTDKKSRQFALGGYASVLLIFVHFMLFAIVLISFIILNHKKSRPFADFHLRQAFAILIYSFAMTVMLGYVPGFLSLSLSLLPLAAAGYGFYHAYHRRMQPWPVIGDYIQEWFKFIK